MRLHYLASVGVLISGILGSESYASTVDEQSSIAEHQLSQSKHTFPVEGELATPDSLRKHFDSLVRDEGVTQQEIAEALFVSQSTVSEFIKCRKHSDYVTSQYLRFSSHSPGIPEEKKKSDQMPVGSFDDISTCLNRALSLSIMPSKLREAATLKRYFSSLTGNNPSRVDECDKVLRLNGQLNRFLCSDVLDSNLTATVYGHLLGYYRGGRLALKSDFHPLEKVLSDHDEQASKGFFARLWGLSVGKENLPGSDKKNF